MDVGQEQVYRDLEVKLDHCHQHQSHLLIITIPGLGISHLLQYYADKHPSVRYLNLPQQPLSSFNLLDLNFDCNPQALNQSQDYFTAATPNQKIALVINTPSLLSQSQYLQSSIPRHLHTTHYFPVRSPADAKILALAIDPQLKTTQINHIYQLSGGISRLMKFLIINPDTSSPEFDQIIRPTATVISHTDPPVLEQIGIIKNHQYQSQLIAQFLHTHPSTDINIKINPDLSFSENDHPSPHPLIKIEKDILEFMLTHNGFISREKVSDLKWGAGKYDQFSDLAIGKTMRRLSHKLTHHYLKTIPKVGYTLIPTIV